MGLRETLGGKVEEVLNGLVDKIDADSIKVKLHAEVDKMVDKYVADVKEKLKADVIDLIDGEDDIK